MSNLRAALVLTLNDQLTAGLNRFKSQIESLRNLGRTLGLGKLQDGASILDKNAQAARGLTRSLTGVAGAADRAWAAMKRAGSATTGWGKKTFGPMSRTEAFTGLAEGFSVIEPIRSFAGFENIARHSAITEGLSGKALEAESQRLMAMFRRDALATSQSSTSIAQAYQDLIQTGIKPEQAEKLLPIHSRAATAYNISPEALGHAVFALSDSFKIGEGDMGGALAAMALASKEGRFKVEDFSRFLPGIGGQLAGWNMTGRSSANLAFAALETVMKNAPDPGSGAADFADLMTFFGSKSAAHSLALDSKGMDRVDKEMLARYHISGISLPAILEHARKSGVDPLTMILGTIQKKVQGLPPDVMMQVLGLFFGNQQSATAARALISHAPDFLAMRDRLAGADAGILDRDFASANAAPQKKLDLLMEQLTQLTQMAGSAFLPILTAIVTGLRYFSGALDVLDKQLPGVKNGVLLALGSFLALSAVVAVFRVALPALTGAWWAFSGITSLVWKALTFLIGIIEGIIPELAATAGVTATVMAAFVVLAAVLVGAAVDIYENWQAFAGFFERMWQGIKDVFIGVAEFIGGFFLGDMAMSIEGIKRIWKGLGEFLGGLWGTAKQLFLDFVGVLDGWTGGAIIATFHAIRDAVGSVIDKIHEWIEALRNSGAGKLLGLGETQPGAGVPDVGVGGLKGTTDFSNLPAAANGNVNVTIGFDEYGRPIVAQAKSDSPNVQVSGASVNPGQTLGRH